MTLLSDFKDDMRAGAVLEVTNHYLTRQDHPGFGTTERNVTDSNSAAFYLTYATQPHRKGGRLAWPKAAQLVLGLGPDGGVDGRTWSVFGGGAYRPVPEGQLFLTIKVKEKADA